MTFPISIPETVVTHPVTGAVLFTSPAVTLTELKYSVAYDNDAKTAVARFTNNKLRYCRPLTLWKGDAYDAAGQFGDLQVAARVDELLGADPATAIIALIKLPVRS